LGPHDSLRTYGYPLLRTSQLTKQYGSVTVVDHVDFEVRAGETHALLGANGAGKSTFCRMIAGLVTPSAGSLQFLEKPITFANKQDAEAVGIEIVQQELNLIPTLSIAENLFFGRLPQSCGIIQQNQLFRRAAELLARVSLGHLDPAMLVQKLGVGQQQLIEIAKALGRSCRLLILDEPTAALSHRESQLLFEQMTALKSQGVGIIYISHRLDEIKHITDRLTILRDGKLVATHDTRDVSIETMIRLMSGTDSDDSSQTNQHVSSHVSSSIPMAHDSRSDQAIVVENLSCGMVRDISFSVRRGERLGITGLVGAGRTELLRALFGADQAKAGAVYIGSDPKPYRFSSPSQAVRHGLVLITEDRKQSGLLLAHSIRDNSILASLWTKFSRGGLFLNRKSRRQSQESIVELDVRCRDMEQAVGTLSGGTQQKVVLAKWLLRGGSVFLFDEPTRGIDIAARRRIYDVIADLAREGKGIIVVSSDLEELLETCDRIAVMSLGRLVKTFDRSEFDREKIMDASFVGHRDQELPTHE
jgi:ribose transport system ATP-binding protein